MPGSPTRQALQHNLLWSLVYNVYNVAFNSSFVSVPRKLMSRLVFVIAIVMLRLQESDGSLCSVFLVGWYGSRSDERISK